jgi:hypothetical protein
VAHLDGRVRLDDFVVHCNSGSLIERDGEAPLAEGHGGTVRGRQRSRETKK